MKEATISSLVSLFPLPQYVVVLEDAEKTRLVPIWIGVNEGNAIALEMNGEKFPRPLTHDLMVNIMEQLKAKIEKVIITDIKDNSYFAEIVIRQNGKSMSIDARPSDSLALAVRIKCPIFIAQNVLEKCPTIDKPISQDEVERFKEDLKQMSPEDFFKRLEATAPADKTEEENDAGEDGELDGENVRDEPEDEEPDEEAGGRGKTQ